MNKRILLLVLVFFLFYLCSIFYKTDDIKIPVNFSYGLLKPLVEIEIEKNKYDVLIDLGSVANELTLERHALEKIKNKEELGDEKIGDAMGNSYLCPKYLIKEVKLGKELISNLRVIEQSREFLYNAQLWPQDNIDKVINNRITKVDGKIGLPAFQNFNCLFDFPNSEIILQKLTNKNSIKEFTCVPFSIEECGIILSIETDMGLQKMVLDTGSTFSVLKDTANRIELEKEKWYIPTNHLIMSGCDYGPWDFAFCPISNELGIDGCIGADFFLEHAIYLDFQNQKAYIQKPEKFPLLAQWKRLKVKATRLYHVIKRKIALCQNFPKTTLADTDESTEVIIEITWDFNKHFV